MTTKDAPKGNLTQIDRMYEQIVKTGSKISDVRKETAAAHSRGEAVQRVERRMKDLTPDIEPVVYQNAMNKTYGGSANLNADRYVKL